MLKNQITKKKEKKKNMLTNPRKEECKIVHTIVE